MQKVVVFSDEGVKIGDTNDFGKDVLCVYYGLVLIEASDMQYVAKEECQLLTFKSYVNEIK